MRISAIQPDISIGNIKQNYHTVASMLEEAVANSPDIILLPELWPTGFYPKNIQEYTRYTEPALEMLSALSTKYKVNIVGGSIATSKGDNTCNTCYCFNRKGEMIASYDKLHLFSPANEHIDFTPGSKVVSFHLDGVKCGVVICYDIRFPELIRQLALESISILFVPAAWPAARREHWDILLRARAIENQIFIAGVNSVTSPESSEAPLGGHSAIIDPWGKVLAQGPEKEKAIITTDIDLAVINNIRESINVFRDRRKDIY